MQNQSSVKLIQSDLYEKRFMLIKKKQKERTNVEKPSLYYSKLSVLGDIALLIRVVIPYFKVIYAFIVILFVDMLLSMI